jgi:hypothetical protein
MRDRVNCSLTEEEGMALDLLAERNHLKRTTYATKILRAGLKADMDSIRYSSGSRTDNRDNVESN